MRLEVTAALRNLRSLAIAHGHHNDMNDLGILECEIRRDEAIAQGQRLAQEKSQEPIAPSGPLDALRALVATQGPPEFYSALDTLERLIQTYDRVGKPPRAEDPSGAGRSNDLQNAREILIRIAKRVVGKDLSHASTDLLVDEFMRTHVGVEQQIELLFQRAEVARRDLECAREEWDKCHGRLMKENQQLLEQLRPASEETTRAVLQHLCLNLGFEFTSMSAERQKQAVYAIKNKLKP